jgi:hypothetical protein
MVSAIASIGDTSKRSTAKEVRGTDFNYARSTEVSTLGFLVLFFTISLYEQCRQRIQWLDYAQNGAEYHRGL